MAAAWSRQDDQQRRIDVRGEWKEGKRHGLGLWCSDEGKSVHEGQWEADQTMVWARSGTTTVTLSSAVDGERRACRVVCHPNDPALFA